MADLLITYAPFLIAALLLNISPGPDLAYVSAQTAIHGRKIGVFSSLGVCSGAFVHVVAAALGLSAILATSAVAFSIVKWVGVAYLVWLGIGALRGSFAKYRQDDSPSEPHIKKLSPARQMTAFQAWRQGAMIDVLNPKVAIFFMAFLPQFVDPAAGDAALQFLVLGTLVNVIGFCVETTVVFAIGFAAIRLRGSPMFGVWLQRLLGGVFIALGVRLALSER
ncbi:LysE family translocator [Thalassospira alkalitolerans]|uniref:Lysine transporter LysE n=1 Tax=Thalassospira alkalitolerans TaxID=1293890 RepID=A0A1Y2LFJ6_9PROT|nr:LysE family translocator [Thalassospira alkalitolerans]OSQ49041.1 lysine transporter LysE [Thalassospira alkalitolerans]